jgi:hypothetical protein
VSPAEELRAAAVLLRERAQDATPGPWEHEHTGPGGSFMGVGQVVTYGDGVEGGDIAGPTGDCYPRGGYSPAEDMAYIATVDPLVGLALADLLDEHARQVEAVSGKVAKALDPRPEYTRLARLILAGGDS